jgi:hypothetical protein
MVAVAISGGAAGLAPRATCTNAGTGSQIRVSSKKHVSAAAVVRQRLEALELTELTSSGAVVSGCKELFF